MSGTYTMILFLLLIGTSVRSQNSYRFRHIGVEDGLSQGSIYHMLKDSRGFLWMGSQDGINRFDGKNNQVYLSGASGESTNVQGIAEDSLANLWIGSHKGVYVYLRKKNKFIRPVLKSSPGEVSVHVLSDRKKNIYLLSESGLYKIQNGKITLLTPELVYNRTQYNNFLVISSNGDFWMLDVQKGLKRFSPSESKIYYYFSGHPDNVYGKPETFSCLSFDRAGNLWLGGRTGLIRFDYNKNTIDQYQKHFYFDQYNLLDIAEDQQGLLWLATEGNGIFVFDPHQKKIIQHILHEEDIPNSLRFNEVSKIYIDENNDIFANSDPQGLDILTAVSSAFVHYTFGKNPSYNLSNYSVRGLAEDADSSIWIGTELGGMDRLNPKTGKISHYTSKSGLPENIIRYILKDPENRIWVATLKGLAVFMPEQNRFKEIILPIPCEITTIISVGPGLLMLSTSKGVMLFDTAKMKVTDHSFTGLIGGYAAYYDEVSGYAYLSNRHRGINVFSILNKKVILKKKLLESFHVLQINHQTGNPFLWACSDRGLIKWDIKKDKIAKIYGVKDGLHHEYIYSVLPDYMGRFWLSTNRGLSLFDPVTERFEFIKEIPPREYNSRAALAAKGGTLYFGSTTGLDRIQPNLRSLKNEHVGVHITEAIFDQPGQVKSEEYIDELQSLQLPYSSNTITLKFTATDFRSGGLNSYRYFLKGYDRDTIYSGAVNQVRYARLPAGTYVFNIQASDLGGNWISNVRKLTIKIFPPFWQTWWFILLIIVFLAGLLFISVKGYLNYRLRVQRRESDKRISLEQERSRIARDINDSLGSELFGLKLLGQVALSKTNRDEADSYLQKIVDVSKSISEKISEVIWLTDANQDNAESLWNYIQKNAMIYLKPSGIDYHFEAFPENHIFTITGERRHEILNFHKQLFLELTQTCDFKECELIFRIQENNLVITLINTDLQGVDESLFKSLNKLGGIRLTSPISIENLEIPFNS